jgi:chromosome segregation protein
MRLKNLEIVGFKSFAQKTEFDFEGGVTAIVGPNGCGKSNVVDSINWVLGTLSSKLIRGEEMLDVIFKGSENLPPMAYAQVALTLDNSDHTLPVPFEDVTVSRKIYRSGECEYFINKALVRLKDIKEMFLNTGLGVDNYSIVEQGKIEGLILSNPKQRRFIFDEVAGISKYKVKRKEAQQKLEKVNQDLLRMEDLLKQIEHDLHSVRIQAGRARKFAELQTEYREKRVQSYLHDYKEILQEMSTAATETEALSASVADKTEAHDRARAELEARETARGEAGEAAQKLRLRMTELQGVLSNLQAAVARGERDQADLRKQRIGRIGELRALRRKADGLRALGADGERRTARLTAAADRIAALVGTFEKEIDAARAELAQVETEAQARQSEAFDLARRESQYRSERAEIEAQRKALADNLGRIQKNLEKIETDLQEAQIQLETAEGTRAAASRTIQENLERRTRLEEEKQTLEVDLDRSGQDLAKLKSDREAMNARRDTLKDLETKLSGIESGSKTLLDRRAPGLAGLVADHLDVDDEHVACTDAILRDLQGYVVADSFETALQSLETVRANQWGGVGIVAMGGAEATAALHPERKTGGVLGRAGEFIRVTDERLARALAPILNRYLVVADLNAARAAVASGTRDPIVTIEGILIDGARVEMLQAGRLEKSLLSRRSHLQQLKEQIEQTDAEIAALESRRQELRRRHKEMQQELESIRHAVYDRQVELRSLQDQTESLQEKGRILGREREALQAERQAIQVEAEGLREREARMAALLEELDGLKRKIDREAEELSRRRARFQEAVERLRKRPQELRVVAGKIAVRLSELEQKGERTFQELRSMADQDARLEELIGDLDIRARQAATEREEAQARIAAAEEELAAATAAEAEARSGIDGLEAAVEEAATAVEALEEELGGVQERLQELKLKANEHRIRAENLEARAREDIEMDLRERASSYVEPADVDWKGLQEEVNRLKGRLQSFGNVNMLALEKLQELEEREKFCKDQRRDLLQSKKELEEFIDKVNKESHELFHKTIEVVRRHFHDIFRKVFGGGKADIVVEAEPDVDPLDQGVEVVTKLPKKEISKLSLMSGGEKSLTAIALTLALFKARPTAFCILDECDAALDESNVHRYAALIQEFSKETQFIVITHNKRTMMVADKLYGITMSPPGVTRRVSVSFEKAAQMVEEPKKP